MATFEEVCARLRAIAKGDGVEHEAYGETARVKFYIGGRVVVTVSVAKPHPSDTYRVQLNWPAQVPTDTDSARVFAGVVQRAAWVGQVAEAMLFEREEPPAPWDEEEAEPDDVGLAGADACELAKFANEWSGLGTAVTDQVLKVLDRGEDADVNPAAIQLAVERIGGQNAEIDSALTEYLLAWAETDDD